MFHSEKRRSLLLLSTVLAFCVLLTSCGNVPFLDRLFGGASYDIIRIGYFCVREAYVCYNVDCSLHRHVIRSK